MNVILQPGELAGTVKIPASKSQAHRLLICAALSAAPVTLECDGISKDIAATVHCLQALGAKILVDAQSIHVTPISAVPADVCHLFCGESGSTLRFLLPVAGALGADCVFHMEGRLPTRPLSPLDGQLLAHGMTLRQEGALLHCSGRLQCGEYSLAGNVSSQYISGLLMALPRLDGGSTLSVTEPVESAAYIAMTEDALRLSGATLEKSDWDYRIPGGQHFLLPRKLAVEGDYSSAAFFLCAGALSEKGVTVTGLNPASSQGDRAVVTLLRQFGATVSETQDGVFVQKGTLRGIRIDASGIPDLIPVLSVVAAVAEGETVIEHAARLRLKESDRLQAVSETLKALNADVDELPDGLTIRGKPALLGGNVSSCGDHRIAMMAAVAACVCKQPVCVGGSESVEKSYPRFWQDYASVKGARP